jgi:polysaccharide pyruvyl transferase WcaK-like protein
VVGYGGANNTGAEARTAGAIDQILKSDKRIRVTLTSLDREQTLRYLPETERLCIVQINPVFIFCMLRLVLRSDIVVLVEGSCFKDNFSSALLWFFMYSAGLAQKLKKPTVAYAVDAGNMKSSNMRWAKDVANKMDLLMTRTQTAAGLLREIGVRREIRVTTDTAFTLEPAGEKWAGECLASSGIDQRWPVVGIAFEELFWWPVVVDLWRAARGVKKDRYKSIYYHSWEGQAKTRSKKMKQDIAAYADFVAKEHGAQIVFFAMERLDAGPCKDVMSLMKFKSVLFDSNNFDAAQMTALLRRLSWLVTCRYHALIMSMGGGVPVIGVAHDERIETVMEELGMKEDYFIDYKQENILFDLKNKTHKLLSRHSEVSQKIREAFPAYIRRMEENAAYFSELIRDRFPN